MQATEERGSIKMKMRKISKLDSWKRERLWCRDIYCLRTKDLQVEYCLVSKCKGELAARLLASMPTLPYTVEEEKDVQDADNDSDIARELGIDPDDPMRDYYIMKAKAKKDKSLKKAHKKQKKTHRKHSPQFLQKQ